MLAVLSNARDPALSSRVALLGHFCLLVRRDVHESDSDAPRPRTHDLTQPRSPTMAAAVETEAQKYIRENGMAPRAVPELDEALKEALRGPKVTQCQGWDGQGRLAPYAELKETMTQTYRLLGEECVVQGCTNKVDAPKYVMELVGGPVCMACGQKIVLQDFRGKSAKPFEPEFEQPTHEDIVRAKEAGLKLPAWAEEALAAEGG